MTPTPFLSVIPQRHAMDCAVSCLAMLLGESYEKALTAFRHNVIAQGATTNQIRAAAKVLGRSLRWRRAVDLESDSGLLAVTSPRWPSHHLVVLKDEMVVDTDATIWEVDVFMAAYDARPLSILTVED